MAACTTVGGTLRLETGNVSRLSPIDHVVRIVGDWEMIGTSLNRDDLDRMAALSSIGGVIRIENNADLYVCKVEELAARMTPPVSVIDLGGNRNWNICDGND